MEQLQQQFATLAAQFQQYQGEAKAREQRLQQQLLELQSQNLGQLVQVQTELVKSLSGRDRVQLVDNKGIRKPSSFNGTEASFLPWKTKLELFVCNVFPDMAGALEWAEEHVGEITETSIQAAFGNAQLEDHIPNVGEKQQQLYTVLQQLCDTGEAFDIVNNSGKGRGLEAWRRLNKRYDPSTGRGRKGTGIEGWWTVPPLSDSKANRPA